MLFDFYGKESLPSAFSADEEREVLALLATSDAEDARYSLIEHNMRLVVYIASRYAKDPIAGEDLVSVGMIGLIKAVDTFDPDKKTRLSTYAARCIENEIFVYLRNVIRHANELSFDDAVDIDGDGDMRSLSEIISCESDPIDEWIEAYDEKNSLREALERLDRRERDFVEMRFGLSDESGSYMTQTELAKVMGVSQAYLSKFEKKIMKHLKEEIIAEY